MLIQPVVVHHPDFFGAGAGADEVDFCLGDAVNAAAEAKDDLVSETVGDGAGRLFAGGVGIVLAKDLGAGGVAGIEKPGIDDDLAVDASKRTEGEHGGAGRCGRPLGKAYLLRSPRSGWRSHALRDQVEDAGVT